MPYQSIVSTLLTHPSPERPGLAAKYSMPLRVFPVLHSRLSNEQERLALIQNLKKTRLGNPQPWLRELSDKGESVYQQICEARIGDVEEILDEYLGAPLEEFVGGIFTTATEITTITTGSSHGRASHYH